MVQNAEFMSDAKGDDTPMLVGIWLLLINYLYSIDHVMFAN